VSRASLPGKSAGQVCRASLPGKSAGQVCRASLPGKSAGQVWSRLVMQRKKFTLISSLIMSDHVWSCLFKFLIMYDHVWSCLIMFDQLSAKIVWLKVATTPTPTPPTTTKQNVYPAVHCVYSRVKTKTKYDVYSWKLLYSVYCTIRILIDPLQRPILVVAVVVVGNKLQLAFCSKFWKLMYIDGNWWDLRILKSQSLWKSRTTST
jgi:hypothetical protein